MHLVSTILSSVVVFASLLLISNTKAAETVTITQKSTGRAIDVAIEKVEAGKVHFTLASGQSYAIAASDLTPESIEAIKAHLAAASAPSAEQLETFAAVNDSVGQPLFGDGPIWAEKAGEVAERLGWKLESKKASSSSYRLYTKPDYAFLGARPYCVTLYAGEDEVPERFSLVFANKGDFGSRLGSGEDHFKIMHPDREPPGNLTEAIELDAEVISETLSTGLGEPAEQYFGEKEDRRKVARWDAGEHAFLLSSLEDEYVSLLIVPTRVADAEGKIDFIVDSDFRKIQIENVRQEANGDVWIDNIPMVDQGPKGYCAPATFERAMRYMRVPADMYLLATAATAPGGGTNTTKLSEDCKRIVRSKARRIRELELHEDFEIDELKKFIDEGVPVLWQMRSLNEYNRVANERTEAREAVDDFSAWATEIQAEAEALAPKLNAEANHHICMIIGYNEQTNEVAVSDSWGPRYELRWVHVDIAKAVTSRGGFVIDF
ncbi:MAG: C39 family peptidase [Verrucomicrobiota bacterium]